MPTVTINVSKELKERMDKEDSINWSGVARKAFEKQLTDFAFFERMAQKVDMTEEDTILLGRELKRNARKFYE